MNCNEIRELLPELASGTDATTLQPEVNQHIASCVTCATHLRDLQKTMALLDEWQAPEPSPYFDTRMQALLREEMARPRAAWLSWLRRPAWAMSLAAVFLVGVLSVGVVNKPLFTPAETIATNPPSPGLPVQPGTAVGD